MHPFLVTWPGITVVVPILVRDPCNWDVLYSVDICPYSPLTEVQAVSAEKQPKFKQAVWQTAHFNLKSNPKLFLPFKETGTLY